MCSIIVFPFFLLAAGTGGGGGKLDGGPPDQATGKEMQRPAVGEQEAVNTEQRSWPVGERWVGEPAHGGGTAIGRARSTEAEGSPGSGVHGEEPAGESRGKKPPERFWGSTRSAGKAVDPRGEGGGRGERCHTEVVAAADAASGDWTRLL